MLLLLLLRGIHAAAVHLKQFPGPGRLRHAANLTRSYNISYAVVTCEIKLFRNDFEIISVIYFTRNHRSPLRAKYNR